MPSPKLAFEPDSPPPPSTRFAPPTRLMPLSESTSPLRRVLAIVLAAVVLVVSGLAFAPDLHQRLHGHEKAASCATSAATALRDATGVQSHDGGRIPPSTEDESFDRCVIALFAQGVDSPWPVLMVLPGPLPEAGGTRPAEGETPRPAHYRLQPSRGPPVPRPDESSAC